MIAYALPSGETLAKLSVGDSFNRIPVAHSAVGADGRFQLKGFDGLGRGEDRCDYNKYLRVNAIGL